MSLGGKSLASIDTTAIFYFRHQVEPRRTISNCKLAKSDFNVIAIPSG